MQQDAFGVADVVHQMLFGKPIEISKAGNGRWRMTSKLKRTLQTSLWNDLFDELLNDGTKLDERRVAFEQYLGSNPFKAKAVKTGLCRLQIMLYESSKRN